MTLHLGSKNGTLIWVTLYIQHILNVYTSMYVVYEAIRIIIIIIYLGP